MVAWQVHRMQHLLVLLGRAPFACGATHGAEAVPTAQVIRQMYPPEQGPTAVIPETGPAPVLLRVAELQKARPELETSMHRACSLREGDPAIMSRRAERTL